MKQIIITGGRTHNKTELVKIITEVSDATGLSIKEVEEMFNEFKYLDNPYKILAEAVKELTANLKQIGSALNKIQLTEKFQSQVNPATRQYKRNHR